MASSAVFEIPRLDLQECEIDSSASINLVEDLTSYNWIEAPETTPTIAVPGCPALWAPPPTPTRVDKDSGLIYISQNAARHPEYPLEPLFRALYTTHPLFDITPIDIVTDRNNMRKLLSFVDPGSSRNGLEPFKINVEIIKNTAIFCREEVNSMEFIGPNEFRGFGHEFEKAHTASQIYGSTGHHRVISYHFGGLKFLVRYETDGYLAEKEAPSDEYLSKLLDGLSLSASKPGPESLPPQFAVSKLRIKKLGQTVSRTSTIEIKTRVIHKPLDLQQIIPQLWISQTPNLVRAYHQNGVFTTPMVQNVTTEIQDWEKRNHKDLQKLAILIRRVISLARQCGGTAVVQSDGDPDKLLIYKVDRKKMLPQDLYSKWDEDQEEGVGIDDRHEGSHGLEVAEAGRQSTDTPATSSDGVKTPIRTGVVSNNVDLAKFPYLSSFVQCQKTPHPEGQEPFDDTVDLSIVALQGVKSGCSQCIQSLPALVHEYRILFQT
ncbi:hypothetical protein PV10_08657 [Exophiala mesophila]|uniref:Geranylgeranyl pyrophosphate synthetase n=1 Tax=Exophiala mesophila TaxID=212818 RepID=A0A0D1ZQL9_EXOME|nr:uncharacterized protein PV10_08657 [Exophiala mesophila]KIV89043.1 hypothetical protein PV10_08657 [Exophiala mesophila]